MGVGHFVSSIIASTRFFARLVLWKILTFAGLFATVNAEWYAIYNETTWEFLDSDNTNVKTNTVNDISSAVDVVDQNNDKGMRWKFRDDNKNGSYISSQAHEDHIVGYDADDNEFHADFKTSNTGLAVRANFIDDTHVTLCDDTNCIGNGGGKSSRPVSWAIKQIQGA